jgi:hypothetical protein
MRNEGGGRVDELVENIRGGGECGPAEIAVGVKAQQKQLNSTTSTTTSTSTSTVRRLE